MKDSWNAIAQFFRDIFSSGSEQASDINRLFAYFLIMSAFILTIVLGMVIIGSIRYRSSRRPETPSQETGSLKIEVLWTVVPFLIVGLFFFLSLWSMQFINKMPVSYTKPDIIITGHQWWWEMEYPKLGIRTANELHVPVGKPLLMHIQTADVIHSWWVPDLGRKIDAVSGRINSGWIKADRPGVYSGTCSEFCGAEHAWMRISVYADPRNVFDTWAGSQGASPPVPTDSMAKAGYMIFMQKTCANCHAVKGSAALAAIGPDLTHIASRQTLFSGMKPNTRENLAKWLRDPQSIKPGAHMPNFLLSNNDINALVSFLEGLK
jgi:cytochrome c oxidase subunit 2